MCFVRSMIFVACVSLAASVVRGVGPGEAGVECLDCSGAPQGEPCGKDTDVGCSGGPPEFRPLDCGETFCGVAWATGGQRDTDWFRVELPEGSAALSASLVSEFPGVVFILNDNCQPQIVAQGFGSGDCAGGAAAVIESPSAASYVVFVSPGNPDGSGVFDGYPCGGANDYELTLTCNDTCSMVQGCVTGDLSGDGLVTPEDIDPFVSTILAPCDATASERCAADVDGSGTVDGADVGVFVNMLLAA